MTSATAAAERLERAISHTPGYAVIVFDDDGVIEQWNRGAAEIFGYSAEEAVGMHAARLFTPEDVNAGVPEQELGTARKNGQASDRRWQQRKDGTRFFADGLSIAAFREDHTVDGFVKILRDATTEKRAEDHVTQVQAIADIAYSSRSIDKLLADLMAHFCKTFDCDTAAVLLLDESSKRLQVRAGIGLGDDVEKNLSMPVGEGFAGLIASRNEPLIWNDPAPERFVSEALRAKSLKAIMGVPLRVDGSVIGVTHVGTARPRIFDHDDVNLLQLAADRIALAVENARLFSRERADAERAAFLADAAALLSSSLEFERTIAEVAQVAVPRLADWCAVDLVEAGVVRRVAVHHVDPAKIALVQQISERYPPRPDAPVGVHHVLRTGEAEMIPQITDEMIRAGAVDDEHYRLITSLGLRSWMSVPLCTRDDPFGVLTFAWAESNRSYSQEDFSFAKELGSRAALAIENARLYREANLATRARDAFLAMLSHELRTPMTSILGWVTMLQQGGLDEETHQAAIDSIEQSARLQAHLIEDLLDVSRTIAGKLHIEKSIVDAAEVARAAAAVLQPQAQANSIRVITDLPPAGAATVEGDAQRLQQVISNLLSNAVKFTPRGGLVTLRVIADETTVCISVRDTGRGISRALLPHIFDPFRQAEGMDRRRFGGLGLGLAIVRTLAEMHSGTVRAESEGEGKGATFIVTLPRAGSRQSPNARV